MSRPCRWGILSAALIARKNWQAMRRAGNAQLVAVASRDQARAQEFIDQCQGDVPQPQPPEALGSYEALLARKDIDAVYIPLPTGLRKDWVVRAAEAGKHVLCEKPVGVSTSDVRAMLDACRRNNVQFMDGVMFMHSARLQALRAVLDDGQSVGPLKRITSQFSFRAPAEFLQGNIRVSSELEPQGCLGDLGWYTIRFALWTMKYAMPERVTGRLLAQHGRGDSRAPVPMDFSAELLFPGGVSSGFYCSFLAENQQWAVISGEKGYVSVRDFVIPYFGASSAFEVTRPVFLQQGCDFNMVDVSQRHAVREYSSGGDDAQETNMIRRFGELVLSGKPDPTWGEIALKTQIVLDACLESSRQDGRPVTISA